MTQQPHSQAYALRKPKLQESHVSHCSWQHYFTIVRTRKQPRCPSTDEWIKRSWYLYTMEYYSTIERNSFESVLMRWMNKYVHQNVVFIFLFLTHFPRIIDSRFIHLIRTDSKCKSILQYHFSSFHIYVLEYDIYLSDSLHLEKSY